MAAVESAVECNGNWRGKFHEAARECGVNASVIMQKPHYNTGNAQLLADAHILFHIFYFQLVIDEIARPGAHEHKHIQMQFFNALLNGSVGWGSAAFVQVLAQLDAFCSGVLGVGRGLDGAATDFDFHKA